MSFAKKLNGEKYDGCALMRWMIGLQHYEGKCLTK